MITTVKPGVGFESQTIYSAGLEPVDQVLSASDGSEQDNSPKVASFIEAIAPLTFDSAVLAGFRIEHREHATATAEKTLAAGQSATETILLMASSIQEMKARLSRKEFGTFVKDLLQWVGEEARKYLDIARAFDGFDLSRLLSLEPFTLLKLRSKRYAPVVAALREQPVITPKVVQDLIRQVLPKQPRKKTESDISGWKRNTRGGGRHYEVLLHDETTGLSIEQQAQAEGILPQKVIAEAVALRAKHKEATLVAQVTELVAHPSSEADDVQEYGQSHTKQVEELAPREIALFENQLSLDDAIAISLPSESVDDQVATQEHSVDQHLEQQVAAIAVPPEAILAGENRSEVEWVLNAPIDELEAVISSVPVRSAYRALYLLNRFQSSEQERMELLEQRVTEYHIAIGAVDPTEAIAPEQTTEHELETIEATDYDQKNQASQALEQGLDSDRSVEKVSDTQNLGPEQNSVLKGGDLVEIDVTRPNGDKTWNGLFGYVQELKPSTGKAVVLLQGDYRSQQFFNDELKLVESDEAENFSKDALVVTDCLEKSSPAHSHEAQPEPQVFQVGDKVEIVSARHGDDLVWQLGIVKVANSSVGCVVEVARQVRWFCTDEIVLLKAATQTVLKQEKDTSRQLLAHNV
jgi:hypothetical protein